MTRSRRSAAWLITGLCLAGSARAADLQQGALVGTWLLESVTATAPDGSIDRAPYGERPTGYLTYTADGDRLTLTTPPTAVGGVAREFALTWRRAARDPSS